jgi:hypothetical protein
MKMAKVFVGAVLLAFYAAAQVKAPQPPISLDVLVEGLGDSYLIEVATLIEQIQRRGIDFDLGNQLGPILSAARKGNRDPVQVATLVTACLRACQDCRARFLTPMTVEEMKTLRDWRFTPKAVTQEARIRGVMNIEISEAAANVLRDAGASEELVHLLVPDDKVPTFPLAGYKTLALKRAEEYDPSAPEGWIKINTELPANSQSEFVFKHNGLFAKIIKGGEPKDLGAYFNKPAPRDTSVELIKWVPSLESGEDEKRSVLNGLLKPKPKPKNAPVVEVSCLSAAADGRNAFRILITNKEPSPQQYSFQLRWKVLPAQKVPNAPQTK